MSTDTCLNSSPIDECGEGACKVCGGGGRGVQASAKGNHGNPVSGNHPGTVTLNTQWKIKYLQYSPRRRGGE